MKKSRGFTLVEVLAAMAIFILIALTLLPLHMTIEQERKNLHDKRIIVNGLHDALQEYIREEKSESRFTKQIGHQKVEIQFSEEKELWKGCAVWTDVKQRRQTECLFTYP